MDENWEVKLAKELPKVELHLHLDGSISPGIFYQNLLELELDFIDMQ